MRMLAGLFCFLTWAWIKSWFVRKPRLPVYTELEIDDDDREMQKEPLLPLPMSRVLSLSSDHKVIFDDPEQKFEITHVECP